MPVIEINPPAHSMSSSRKILKRSWWRKLTRVVAFIQLIAFLVMTVALIVAALIQAHLGDVPYEEEIYDALRAGGLVTTIHREIMEDYHYGVFGPPGLVKKTVEIGIVQDGVVLSSELRTELEEADWCTVLCIYIITAVLAANQFWRGVQLLRACLKWEDATEALVLLKFWRISTSSFRNYLFGFLVSAFMFAPNVPGIIIIVMAALWMTLLLISILAYGYYRQLSVAVSHADLTEHI